jgi:hypothetical protein
MKPFIVINLGWGWQSFTMAAMSALGELDPVDAVIHADTTHERSATYAFARKYTPWLESHVLKVITVKSKDNNFYCRDQLKGLGTPPLYTNLCTSDGMLNRSCTQRWKISPIRRWLQANRAGRPVEQWIGISLDEVERMRDSDVKYITNRYPLIEKRMTRQACGNWLTKHGLEIPPKSACVFCPYHNKRAWWDMKNAGGPDWQKAIEIDRAIRKARPPYDLFVHADRIPLEQIKSPRDNGQLELFSEECSGLCFL